MIAVIERLGSAILAMPMSLFGTSSKSYNYEDHHMKGNRKLTQIVSPKPSAGNGKPRIPSLTASNLKQALWETLYAVKNDEMLPGQADAIASQAREILRTVKTQLQIAQQGKHGVPYDVIEFAQKSLTHGKVTSDADESLDERGRTRPV